MYDLTEMVNAVERITYTASLKGLIRNNKAWGLEDRVCELAKVSPKEAFLLVCQKIRKKDMFKLVKEIEKVHLLTKKFAMQDRARSK